MISCTTNIYFHSWESAYQQHEGPIRVYIELLWLKTLLSCGLKCGLGSPFSNESMLRSTKWQTKVNSKGSSHLSGIFPMRCESHLLPPLAWFFPSCYLSPPPLYAQDAYGWSCLSYLLPEDHIHRKIFYLLPHCMEYS
jgi:hypothetical protein